MAEWYRAMEELGATFSYVSNSPWELWGVVREYLHSTGFPSGSVTLKEYGGASSAIAKLWEEPGMRKRAGVEVIFRQFPHSRFILIGDSGEQDLNLYVALAQVCEFLSFWFHDQRLMSLLPSQTPPKFSASSSATSRPPSPQTYTPTSPSPPLNPPPTLAPSANSPTSQAPSTGRTNDLSRSTLRNPSAPPSPPAPDPPSPALHLPPLLLRSWRTRPPTLCRPTTRRDRKSRRCRRARSRRR